jgi:hypothetical protein
MLRCFLGFAVVTSIVVSCAGDDDKRKVRGDEAGAAGESGTRTPVGAGGSSADPGQDGGAPSTQAGGEGGVPASAGMSGSGGLGNALGGGAGEGTAGTASEAGAGAGAGAGASGAGGADGGGLVSLYCDPGEYYAGEPGCLLCEEEPVPQTVDCSAAFYAKSVLANNGPSAIQLSPREPPREALPVAVDVTYQLADSVEVLHTEMSFNFISFYWEIDVDDIPASATQLRVQPFAVPSVCGDTFTLTDEVIFVTGGGDDWDATCPNQT